MKKLHHNGVKTMNTKTLAVSVLVLIGIFAVNPAFAQQSFTSTTAPVYRVVPCEGPESLLVDNAGFLGLDVQDAAFERNQLGWVIFSKEDFEIRHHKGSGYFT